MASELQPNRDHAQHGSNAVNFFNLGASQGPPPLHPHTPPLPPHLAVTSGVLYCTPSRKGTGASRKVSIEAGVTGMTRHCQPKGRNSGSRPNTHAVSRGREGQKKTICEQAHARPEGKVEFWVSKEQGRHAWDWRLW